MTTRSDSDRAFWSLVLEYARNIFSIYKFVFDGACHHSPVLSKDQFNIIKRVNKCSHDLGNVACFMLSKLNENEKG